VQRAYASGIAGEIPPDQSLPEVWVQDDAQHEEGRSLLRDLAASDLAHAMGLCRQCGERVEGPFEQCWNCGAEMPVTHLTPHRAR
jgi:RNA polymerase-binding transcription factor DksA